MITIYKIINKLDGSVIYIGQSDYLPSRKGSTKWRVKNGWDKPLYNKIRSLGWDNIEYQIHTQVESQTEADLIEHQLIENTSTAVNIQSGGTSGFTHTGKTHSEETKKRISRTQKKQQIYSSFNRTSN